MKKLHPDVEVELAALRLHFGDKYHISLDEYAAFYGIPRKGVSEHLHRRKIPFYKDGRRIFISIVDLATYIATCKRKGKPMFTEFVDISDEMKSRRGYSQMAQARR
jgi:hypothetical protein